MKTNIYNGLLGLIVMIMVIAFTISGCKKNDSEIEPEIESDSNFGGLHFKSNPNSLINVKLALVELGRSDEKLNEDRIYNYYKFNPENFTGDMMKVLSDDSTSHIMEVPFASPEFYCDEIADNWETEEERLKDGNLYIVLKANSKLNTMFENESSLGASKLDELYLPEEEDSSLQLQTIAIAANTTVPELKIQLKICLQKRPKGYIKYKDTETGSLVGVPRIKVWALFFGIPRTDETDNNGYYRIPWKFNVGTLMGIHAENSRMKIKPLNTTGNFLSVVGQLTVNFILGSRKSFGWFNSCRMKKNINKSYKSHSQQRLWCHILHSVKLHYDYTARDGIKHAPKHMVCYAQWANSKGNASAPMLKQIAYTPATTAISVLNLFFGQNINSAAPALASLMLGLLPDMTVKVSHKESDYDYHSGGKSRFSEDIMYTNFHELSHASLYLRVGKAYWIDVITHIVQNLGYGNPTGPHWGKTQVNEAWADFYGKIQHQRLHPNGHVRVRVAGTSNDSWKGYPEALENVPWYYSSWINSGIFYDLKDDSSGESNDQLGRYSISEMYNTFNSNTNSFCDWRNKFISSHPGISIIKLDKLMEDQNDWNSSGCRTIN